MITRWEYQEVVVSDRDISQGKHIDVLNQHGQAGWELVYQGVDSGFGFTYTMKRETHDKSNRHL